MLLGLKSERVDVDANGWDVRVVLEGLDPVEVGTLTDLEPVVAVELEERRDDGVLASHALNTRDGVARLKNRAVPPVRVVEGLLALPAVDDRVIARRERITLNNPDKLLARVVEVELELVRRRRDRLLARELERLNEVLVRDLGELAALVRVKVDVVNVERRGDKVGRVDAVTDRVGVGRELGDVANHLRVAGLLASLLRELIPDVQPLAIVLVDALAADLEFNPVNEVVANPVEPAELGTRAVRRQQGD